MLGAEGSMGRMIPALLLVLGCNPTTTEVAFTTDVRIDGGLEEGDNISSEGTRRCVTDQGVVYVLWMDDREGDGKRDIWMNRSVARGGEDPENGGGPSPSAFFTTPTKVNQGDGNVWNPALACNEVGAFVVWEDDRDGVLENHQIYFNRSIDQGETFNPDDQLVEGNLDPDGNSMSLEPKIVVRGRDLFVTWYDSLNGAYDIFMSSHGSAGDPAEDWRVPIRVDLDDPAGASYSAHPEMAVSENGADVWITWEDSRDGQPDVYIARSSNQGQTFEDHFRLDGGDDEGATESFTPQVCTDGASQVYVFWHDLRGGDFADVYMNFSADKGVTWSQAAIPLGTDAPGLANSLFPKCVMNAGKAHVVWEDRGEANGNYDLAYRVIQNGIPSELQWADAGTPRNQSNSVDSRMATDLDVVAVMWSDDRAAGESTGFSDLYYNFSEGGAGFQEFVDDQTGDLRGDSMYDGQSYKDDLNFAILGGEWYAAWTDGRGGSADVYFQRRAIGEGTTPPTLEDLQAAE